MTGAVYADNDSNAFFGGEIFFAHNKADVGGAIYISGSSVVLRGKTIFANNTADLGGAIYLTDSSELNVTEQGNASFFNNHAGTSGGAVRVNDHSVFNSYGIASFVFNEAEFGGAINLDSSKLNVIGNVSFEGNHADATGGAVYADNDSNAFFGGEIFFAHNKADVG
ncbi:unnamed protein product, partial [Ascophyllum nodosum]